MAISAALTVQAWLGLRQVGLLYALVAIESAVTAVNAPARRSLTPALLPGRRGWRRRRRCSGSPSRSC